MGQATDAYVFRFEGGAIGGIENPPLFLPTDRRESVDVADGWITGLSRVSASGGKSELPTEPDPKREEQSHRLPSWLPNGKGVLFPVIKHYLDSQSHLGLLRLDTRKWNVLLENAADARYVPTGHLVLLRQGSLMAVRFDLARLEVVGQPFALVKEVMQAFSTHTRFHTGGDRTSDLLTASR